MDVVDRMASVALRIASRRLAVFPDGLGNGDLDRLVEKIPLPSSPIPAIDLRWERPTAGPRRGSRRSRRAFERHIAHLDSAANEAVSPHLAQARV